MPVGLPGRVNGRKPNIITSLELKPEEMEKNNIRFQAKYKLIEENEVRFEEINCEDADYLIIAFGFYGPYRTESELPLAKKL